MQTVTKDLDQLLRYASLLYTLDEDPPSRFHALIQLTEQIHVELGDSHYLKEQFGKFLDALRAHLDTLHTDTTTDTPLISSGQPDSPTLTTQQTTTIGKQQLEKEQFQQPIQLDTMD